MSRYAIEYSRQRGPQGATGNDGAGVTAIPNNTLLGNTSGGTAIPVARTASQMGLQPYSANLDRLDGTAAQQRDAIGAVAATDSRLTDARAVSIPWAETLPTTEPASGWWLDAGVMKFKRSNVLVVVSFGESNSGGEVDNSSAFAWELAPRANLKILDLADFTWQQLDIGTNNNRDHFGFTDGSKHAWELGLANMTDIGFFANKDVRLIQTGQGGSRISQWNVGGTYWTKFLARTEYAKSLTTSIAVWLTLGINDVVAGTTAANYRIGMLELIGRIKAQLPTAKIYVQKLMTNTAENIAYNAEIDTMVAADSSTLRVMNTTGVTLKDGFHWDYAGQKTIAQRASVLMSSDYAGLGKVTWSAGQNIDGGFTAAAAADRAKSQQITVADISGIVTQKASNAVVTTIRVTDELSDWSTGSVLKWYTNSADLYRGIDTLVYSGMTASTLVRARFATDDLVLETSDNGGSTWTTRYTWTGLSLSTYPNIWLNVESVLGPGSIFVSLDKNT